MQVWKAILTQEPQFRGSAWAQVSDDAKGFVGALLNKCGSLSGTESVLTRLPVANGNIC